jgi:multisubunit Na+/H+ antiporter MnhC subunit
MLQNALAMAHSCVESVNVILCTLGRNVSAVQVSLSQQELEYPAIVSPVQMQIFLTALNVGLAPVEYVNVLRYGSTVFINFFISLNLVGDSHSQLNRVIYSFLHLTCIPQVLIRLQKTIEYGISQCNVVICL